MRWGYKRNPMCRLTSSTMLSSIDLAGILPRNRVPCYLGDFPIDKLPPRNSLRPPCCFIVNTDPHDKPGMHWIALCIPPGTRSSIIYMDPLACQLHRLLSPLVSLLAGYSQVTTMPYAIQPVNSFRCGAFCAFLLVHLPLYNYALHSLVRHYFSANDLPHNEAVISRWWYKRAEGSAAISFFPLHSAR